MSIRVSFEISSRVVITDEWEDICIVPVDEDVSMAIESADYQSLLISIGMQPPSDMVRNIIINSVLICLQGIVYSAYDKHQNLSRYSLFSTNSMKFPLIMYSKFVRPNLICPDICLIWPGKCLVTGHYYKPWVYIATFCMPSALV